jgi:hypothetical protein
VFSAYPPLTSAYLAKKQRGPNATDRRGPLSAGTFAQHPPKGIACLRTKGLGNGDKFGHVDLSLIALDHTDDGVRPFESRRQLTLRESGLFVCGGDVHRNGARRT